MKMCVEKETMAEVYAKIGKNDRTSEWMKAAKKILNLNGIEAVDEKMQYMDENNSFEFAEIEPTKSTQYNTISAMLANEIEKNEKHENGEKMMSERQHKNTKKAIAQFEKMLESLQ